MFDRIASECEQRALKFTLFVDDIGISGGEIPHEFIRSILAVIGSHGLRAHKTRLWIDRPACLTGAIIWRSQLRLPNRRHFAIAKNRQALKSADIESKSGAKLLSTTVGQCFEASQLVPNLKRVAKQLRLLDPLSGALAAKPSSSPLPQSQPSPNASEANDYFAKMLYDFGPRSVAGERRTTTQTSHHAPLSAGAVADRFRCPAGPRPGDLAAAHGPSAGSCVGRGRQPLGRIRSTSASVSVPVGPVPGARLHDAALATCHRLPRTWICPGLSLSGSGSLTPTTPAIGSSLLAKRSRDTTSTTQRSRGSTGGASSRLSRVARPFVTRSPKDTNSSGEQCRNASAFFITFFSTAAQVRTTGRGCSACSTADASAWRSGSMAAAAASGASVAGRLGCGFGSGLRWRPHVVAGGRQLGGRSLGLQRRSSGHSGHRGS